MAIQINTDSLTKPHQFIFEACKILWQHKRGFFAFALLPMVLDVMENVFSQPSLQELVYTRAKENYRKAENNLESPDRPEKEEINSDFILASQLFFILKWFMASPFFIIAWFRYMLDSTYNTNLRSYFYLQKGFARYGFYSLLFLGIVCMLLKYLFYLHTTNFTHLFFASLDFEQGGDILLMLYPFIEKTLIAIYLVFFYCCLPATFMLPFFSLNKSINILEMIEQTYSYRTRFSLIMLVFMLIWSYVPTQLLNLGKAAIVLSNLEISELQYIIFTLPIAFFLSIISFVLVGIMLNIISLYYKKYLIGYPQQKNVTFWTDIGG